jgi:hypothetical protein
MNNLAGYITLIMGVVMAIWYFAPLAIPPSKWLKYKGWWGAGALILVVTFFALPLCIAVDFCAIK